MIYLSLVPKAFGDLSSLVGCSDAVSTWFLQNALLLNPEKTEAIIFGTRQRLAGTQTSAGVSVEGTVVHFAEAVKLLGVTLDSALTFNQHVTNVVRACTYHTRALRHIRPLLTVDTAKSIAASIVGARWHLRTGLKLNCLNLATHNCFWRHRSAPDSLAI